MVRLTDQYSNFRQATVGEVTGDSDRGQKEWLAGVFDRAAPSYDRVGDSYHDHFGARLVDAAGIGPGMSVLDVACGRGAVLLPAAERVGAAGRVVGVDLSPEMVNRARGAVPRQAQSHASTSRSWTPSTSSSKPRTFDVALCGFGVFFFPHPERAAAEMARVVVPGGVVGLSSWAEEDERWAWDDELIARMVVSRRAISQPFDQAGDLERLLDDGRPRRRQDAAGAARDPVRHRGAVVGVEVVVQYPRRPRAG